MKPSASIPRLKRKARLFARAEAVPLHAALNHVAAREGYAAWSLLAGRHARGTTVAAAFAPHLRPGEIVLLGARPGRGKTLLALDLIRHAVNAGRQAAFFTLEYVEADVLDRLRRLAVSLDELRGKFTLDCSDGIDAEHIVAAMRDAPAGTLVVVDYLQCLEHRRDTPPLATQIEQLRRLARDTGLTVVLISQIDRGFDRSSRPCPTPEDVRLPNPLDLTRLDKAIFLGDGMARLYAVDRGEWRLQIELTAD